MADEKPVAPSEAGAFASPRDRSQGLGAFALLKDVEVEITLEIGRRRMKIEEVLRLSTGATVELSKAAGEPIDVYVNGQLLGRGEAVVVGDRYGVRITELLSPESTGGNS
ncbi:MAG: flagellar motor switch protein FliN [Myxococcales bacterium]|nr:flagellar motor switch protein FliN [Myxococcales bacterium]